MSDSLWDDILWELKQDLFAGIRSELLHSQQKMVVVQLENNTVQRENPVFRNRIEELESSSVSPLSHTHRLLLRP
jgi:hypothetical protein